MTHSIATPRLSRRTWLGGLLAAGVLGPGIGLKGVGESQAKTSESRWLTQQDLILEGDPKLARRSLILAPKVLPKQGKLPVLVLLHGLGETGNELLGIRAWSEFYGLISSYDRLKEAPIERTLKREKYLTDNHLAELNQSLERRPFQDLILVCPVTPNPYRLQPSHTTLDRYASWIEERLLPAVRKEYPATSDPRHTGLDGCSLGGYVGMEVFLRKPQLFGSFGGVQAAFGAPLGIQYAERIAQTIERHGPRALHFETSTEDPYRQANEALSKTLSARRVPHELKVIPGPHNQPWLREIGTLELLLWHSRQLAFAAPPPKPGSAQDPAAPSSTPIVE